MRSALVDTAFQLIRCSSFGALSKDEVIWDMTVGAVPHFGHGDHIRQWNKQGTHTHRSRTIDVAKPDFWLMRCTSTDTFSRISWEKGNPGAGEE